MELKKNRSLFPSMGYNKDIGEQLGGGLWDSRHGKHRDVCY